MSYVGMQKQGKMEGFGVKGVRAVFFGYHSSGKGMDTDC